MEGRLRFVFASVLVAAAAGGAQAAAPIFDASRLHEVRIVMDPKDWQSLRQNFRSNQYYAANIALDGEVLEQIGIRSRGDGSRNEEKPGLKLDFNKYIKTQEFHGYKTMVLDNLWQDQSLMREKLSFLVFEAMGIAAPALSHARLTVNDEYWGVYTIVESVSKPFLKARIGEESGNLFDYEYAAHWDFTVLGGDASSYVPSPFQPQTNEDHLDATGLMAFVRAVNETPDATFSRDIASWLDVPRFLAYLATENAMAESDGMVGEQGVNNFYLYQYGGQNRFVFIPWDKETCLQAGSWPVMQRVETNTLTRRLLTDPANQATYAAALKRAASFVNSRWLLPQMEATYTQIREAVLTDTRKQVDNATFELGIQGLRGVITAREPDILAQVP
jgi:spore coat protein CotH